MREIETKEDLWGYAKRLRFVCESIESVFSDRAASDLSILDVGCGSAAHLGLPLVRLGYNLTGIDFHEPSIALANDLARDFPTARFICGEIDDLDARKFDAVILSEVLEHVADPEKLLRSSLKHLQNSGVVIVTVPNGYGEFEWDSWLYRNTGLERVIAEYKRRKASGNEMSLELSSTENTDNGHVQFFRLERLRQMFEANSLTVISENASTLISGPFVGHTLGRSRWFVDWNARIADKLPLALSSGWFFALRRRSEGLECV